MKDTTLVIMAAGIGSRFGGGIKQLEPVGPKGEIIMDYSIYDAIAAGFNKVVFIIRRDIEKDFKEIIGDRIEKQVKVEYVYQDVNIDDYGFEAPAGRKKPWGTGHAVLCCRGTVKEPFLVINADDYYGKQSFKIVHDYLCESDEAGRYCMAGFILGNTLSENGTVKRGICKTDENGFLTSVTECGDLIKIPGSEQNNGEYLVSGRDDKGEDFNVPNTVPVSMNMFGFTPDFLDELDGGFRAFLKDLVPEAAVGAEFYLPSMVSALIDSGKASVKVLKTTDNWIGVTYREDKPFVVESIRKMVDDGLYPEGILR